LSSYYEKLTPMAIGSGIKLLETRLMNCKVKYIYIYIYILIVVTKTTSKYHIGQESVTQNFAVQHREMWPGQGDCDYNIKRHEYVKFK